MWIILRKERESRRFALEQAGLDHSKLNKVIGGKQRRRHCRKEQGNLAKNLLFGGPNSVLVYTVARSNFAGVTALYQTPGNSR